MQQLSAFIAGGSMTSLKNKCELRAYLRSLYEGKSERDAQSAKICRHILGSTEYKSAAVIGGYMPMAREADVTPVLQDALSMGKMVVLPLCEKAPNMTLRMISSLDELKPGAYGLLEPSRDAPIIPAERVDLLLVPLEGIDRQGFRLGKGGGYYDCLLPRIHGVAIGCALTWQWMESIPREPWDVPLKVCADPAGLQQLNQ